MAVSASPVATPKAAPVESAPPWVFPLYAGGLAVVYLGERVLSGLPHGAVLVTAVGLMAALAATVLRFAPRFRSGGERRSIESLLAVLSVVGLAGVFVYFTTSDFGAAVLRLDQLESEQRVRVEEFARVVWVTLIVVALVPMAFAETALNSMRRAELPESRRVRSAATAGLTLALAAVYGALFVYAAGGVDLKVDYSFFKTSRPSESTRKLAASLSDPIRVVAFFPDVNEVRKEVETYLKEVSAGAPKLKVEIKDRLLVPKLAQELRATQDGTIVLSRGTVTHSLQLGTEIDQARPKLRTFDRDFQEQLMRLARSRHLAYFTVGHGEINDLGRKSEGAQRSAQIARTLLQKQNYTLKDLGLGQGLANDVPEDAELLLVLGPTSPFTSEELSSLKRYVDRGGRLLMALEPESVGAQGLVTSRDDDWDEDEDEDDAVAPLGTATRSDGSAGSLGAGASPNSNADLARLVGLRYVPDLLANEKQHVRLRYNDSDRTRLVSNSFSSHAAVSTLSRNAPRAAMVAFGAASLEKAPGGGSERVDFAVRSMVGTFQDINKNFRQDPPLEKGAVYNLAAAVTRGLGAAPESKKGSGKDKNEKGKKDEKDKKPVETRELRAFVLADADAFSDFVMGEVIGNQILFVDAVRWLIGEESVQGLPNTEEDVRMEHTKQADLGWFYAMIFGAPCLVLGAGVWVSRRSRARGVQR